MFFLAENFVMTDKLQAVCKTLETIAKCIAAVLIVKADAIAGAVIIMIYALMVIIKEG